MPSKLPPTSTGSGRIPNLRKPTVATSHPQAATQDTSFRLTDTFKKRRTTFWAVGVAIIVGAGSILGAQLKEREQAKKRYQITEQDVKEQAQANEAATTTMASTAVTLDNTPSLDVAATADMMSEKKANQSAGTGSDGAGTKLDQRQISFLEDRRGKLMKEKFELERKIDRVREKKKREEEMESRRGVGVVSGR